MAIALDPKTAGPKIKVEVEHRGSGRPDFIVPLQAERRYGGYKATAWSIVRRTGGVDLYEVEMAELPGAPKEFVGDYDV